MTDVVRPRFWSPFLEWAWLTGVAVATLTTVDLYLIDRKYGLFSAAFLADVYLRSGWEVLGFVLASAAADAAILAPLLMLVLRTAAHVRLSAAARVFVTLTLSLAPLAIADFVLYEIAAYIGDAMNLRLLFDLSGRNPRELLTVGGPMLLLLGAGTAAGLAALIGAGWALNRIWPSSPFPFADEPHGFRRMARYAAVFVAVGLVVTSLARLWSPAFDRRLIHKPSTRAIDLVVQWGTDVDGDGFGLLSRPGDPDPWNAANHPWAIDVPGNGVDENGIGGDFPADVPPYVEGPATPPVFVRRPPFVLVVLETFRPDLIGMTVNGREVTPVLNELARRGQQVARAYSHNGFTVQSRYHLFTGSLAGTRGDTSLIDDFKENGYETAFFSAQDESFGSELPVGFERADVSYDARQDIDRRFSQYATPASLGVPHHVLLERITAFLDDRSPDRPLFLTINLQDTHFPYHNRWIEPLVSTVVVPPGEISADRAEDLRAMYVNTAANVDRALGELLTRVRHAVGEDPAVIAFGDHGESLFEEGFLGHGYALNDAQTRTVCIATNLGIELPSLLGQVDVRDAIWTALGPRPATPPPPSPPQVFQYVGTVTAPRQIALVTTEGRTTIDLMLGRVRFPGGSWEDPSRLSPTRRESFLSLVTLWESMLWARRTTPPRGTP